MLMIQSLFGTSVTGLVPQGQNVLIHVSFLSFAKYLYTFNNEGRRASAETVSYPRINSQLSFV